MSSFDECADPHCDHNHDHSHDEHDEHDVDDEDVPPVKRIVIPGDVIELEPNMDTIYIVGTRGEKVTKIAGLDGMVNLKVCYMMCLL